MNSYLGIYSQIIYFVKIFFILLMACVIYKKISKDIDILELESRVISNILAVNPKDRVESIKVMGKRRRVAIGVLHS